VDFPVEPTYPIDFPPFYPLAHLHEVYFVKGVDGWKATAVGNPDQVAAVVFSC
jgi:hypothetical protein